jgi:malate synthase
VAKKPAARRAKAGRKTQARTKARARVAGRSTRKTKSRSAARRTKPKGKVRAAARSKSRAKGLLGRLKRVARKLVSPAAKLPSGVRGLKIKAPMRPRYEEILTAPASQFLADLHRNFETRRQELMKARADKQKRYDAGELPDFLPETRWVRERQWTIAPIPADLLDRRVEITGPVDRKMVINALNSGANVYLADFEDANSPTWDNNLEGQLNLKDRWDGKLDFTDPETGKAYKLGTKLAVTLPRPRGWHLLEEHLTVDGKPIAGALFDFGLYIFHNHEALKAAGTGPYFYLPKMETHQEARLWNDVFVFAQQRLGIPNGTIKATVLIETLPAAFEMDEILWEMRDHITGLNAGRWDYIFSFVKKFAKNKNYILPDRSQVVMGKAFLGNYATLLVQTCHRRGAYAMGGMAAQIPIKNDDNANREAFAKVRTDKEREAREGHDGTWVAHPALVSVAKEVFDRLMPEPNQLGKIPDATITRDMLLQLHEGTKTEAGFRLNIRVGVQYIAAWLGGRGAVPIYNLMEDAATAEISRAQIWQWLKYGATLDSGQIVTPAFFRKALKEEMQRVKKEIGARTYASLRFPEAIKLFSDLSLSKTFADFLTIPAYKKIK